MRKVKSAPANLCLMKNNKNNIDNHIVTSDKKNNIILFNFNNNANNNLKNIRNTKKLLFNVNEITSEMIQNSKLLDSEELNIITLIINYIFENIYKKKKFDELKNYIISCSIRYFIMFIFHTYIIHDAAGKYIHTLDIIHKINL